MSVGPSKKYLVLVAVLISTLVLLITQKSTSTENVTTPNSVFLVKAGPEFLVGWVETEEFAFTVKRFGDLANALRFVESTLEMQQSCQWRPELKLKKLVTDQKGEQIHWKVVSNPYVHRLTFESSIDSKFFYDAFSYGAYSPSPFGHSILFLSKKIFQKRCGS